MRIILNNKYVEVNEETGAFELGAQEKYLFILNGYQISEDCRLKENDIVTLIEKGRMPNEDELYYMMSARNSPKIQDKIRSAKVAVAGLGGLGSNIAVMLARLGIGNLLLVDYDCVEPSNLNRQHYFIKHLCKLKTLALKEQIEEINPYINVSVISSKVDESNAASIFKGYEIVCEAFDNPESKAALVNSICIENPDIKIIAASGMAGFGSSNDIKTVRKFSNLYICGDMKTESVQGTGLMSPRVSICAGHQAKMVLRLIIGEENV